MKVGDFIFFSGSFFEVAEVKTFPHGEMIGIYDEKPKSNHVDYLNPSSVLLAQPCPSCQGGGCPTCGGFGKIVL